jgi:hypothetical protein
LPGNGQHLVNFAKDRARILAKTKVNLNTADPKFPAYYRRFGFEMVSKGAMTGDMEVSVSSTQ